MNVFITGATGFIGRNLMLKLVASGIEIHALFRDESKIRGIRHEKIKWFRGDLADRNSIEMAMKDCQQAYHLGAFANLLIGKPDSLYEQNVQGTVNVLESARKAGLNRVVFTSTAGVLGPSGEKPLDEKAPYPEHLFTHYIRSKILAEKKVKEYVESGMDIVIVNPTRVYGPGILSKSNAASILDLYMRGKWHIKLGNGKGMGNYVYVDDVTSGIILAMEKGKKGERYVLGGENVSFNEWVALVNRITGKKRVLVAIPVFIMVWIAHILRFIAKLGGKAPPFTPDEVRRYGIDWLVSCDKAKSELGYDPLPFEKGMEITIKWLNNLHTP
jgi:nucleoside-diphosphate-sugar epimerase